MPNSLNTPMLLAAILALAVSLIFGSARWRALLKTVGITASFRWCLSRYAVGYVFFSILPSTFGGVAFRGFAPSRNGAGPRRAAAAIVAEKFLGATVLCVVLIVAIAGVVVSGVSVAKFQLGVAVLALIAIGAMSLMPLARPTMFLRIAALIGLDPDGALSRALVAIAMDRASLRAAALCSVGLHASRLIALICITLATTPDNSTVPRILFSGAPILWEASANPVLLGLDPASIQFGIRDGNTTAPDITAAARMLWLVGLAFAFVIFGIGMRVTRLFLDDQAVLPRGESEISNAQSLRRSALAVVLASTAAAGLAGCIAGLAEALWLARFYVEPRELRLLWWGPLVYGPATLPLGAPLGAVFVYLGLFRGKPITARAGFSLSFATLIALAFVVVGRFRYSRDLLDDHPLVLPQIATVLAVAIAAGTACAAASWLTLRLLRLNTRALLIASGLAYAACIVLGATLNHRWSVTPAHIPLASAPAGNPPPVILIVADTLRADYLRIYNTSAEAVTPNLDAFAADAVTFESAFAQAPWTKPSFGTIFTGLYPRDHGAEGKASSLRDDATTLAESLHAAGYFTKGFANNDNIFPHFRFGQGFMEYDVLERELPFAAALSVRPMVGFEGLRRARAWWMAPRVDERMIYMPADSVNAHVDQWLVSRAWAERPPFLFVHYMDAHDPYMSAAEPGVGYGPLALSWRFTPEGRLEKMRGAYIHEIEFLDQHLGALFASLRNAELYDNALIVFTADHGEELFDHGGWWHGETHYDEVIRVPLLMKLPGGQHAGERNTDIACHIDLMPTVLAWSTVNAPDGLPGIPLVTPDGEFHNAATTHAYAESDINGAALRSIRDTQYKLIHANPNNPRGLNESELYDWRADPSEQHDQSATIPSATESLAPLLDSYP